MAAWPLFGALPWAEFCRLPDPTFTGWRTFFGFNSHWFRIDGIAKHHEGVSKIGMVAQPMICVALPVYSGLF